MYMLAIHSQVSLTRKMDEHKKGDNWIRYYTGI